jgi:hypothetical protein
MQVFFSYESYLGSSFVSVKENGAIVFEVPDFGKIREFSNVEHFLTEITDRVYCKPLKDVFV